MESPKWTSVEHFYKDGQLRDTARAFLKEIFFENCYVEPETGCWLFASGRTTLFRYQGFYWRGRHVQAHRFAYALWKGEIPDGLWILHSCDQRPCCNPDHLRAGTAKENTQDMHERGRAVGNGYENKTHCSHGHEFTPENTYHFRKSRICRACHAVYAKAYSDRVQRENPERKREQLRRWRASKKLLTT